MTDPTPDELAAMQSTIPLLGEYVASIGMDRPLSAYSKQEVLTLIEVVVTAYHAYFQNSTEVPF
jgi:hypothetical protein